MVSEEQTITESKGTTCHGKHNTKGTVVSKAVGTDNDSEEKRRQARGGADMRVLARTAEISI